MPKLGNTWLMQSKLQDKIYLIPIYYNSIYSCVFTYSYAAPNNLIHKGIDWVSPFYDVKLFKGPEMEGTKKRY